jgi:hypothetical protein
MGMLSVAFEDFIFSREAMLCTPQTIDFYRRMLTPSLSSQTARSSLIVASATISA